MFGAHLEMQADKIAVSAPNLRVVDTNLTGDALFLAVFEKGPAEPVAPAYTIGGPFIGGPVLRPSLS